MIIICRSMNLFYTKENACDELFSGDAQIMVVMEQQLRHNNFIEHGYTGIIPSLLKGPPAQVVKHFRHTVICGII